MSNAPQSQNAAPFAEFYVETAMTDVEIFRVFNDRILAGGKRFGRMWLLRGLPPAKRNEPTLLRELREEFDRRYIRREIGLPLTVGMEEIEGLGPCIVEEWSEDYPMDFSLEDRDCVRKRRRAMRSVFIITIALIAIAGVWGFGSYISNLTVRSETANADLEALRLANRQSETRMQMLADSLDKVLSGSLIPEDFVNSMETMEEDREEWMTEVLYQASIKEFQKELVRYDRYVLPEVTDHLPVFYDSICALYRHMLDIGANVDPSGIFPQLPEDDRIRLKGRLYGECLVCALDYTRLWFPKAYSAYEKKKGIIGFEKND